MLGTGASTNEMVLGHVYLTQDARCFPALSSIPRSCSLPRRICWREEQGYDISTESLLAPKLCLLWSFAVGPSLSCTAPSFCRLRGSLTRDPEALPVRGGVSCITPYFPFKGLSAHLVSCFRFLIFCHLFYIQSARPTSFVLIRRSNSFATVT